MLRLFVGAGEQALGNRSETQRNEDCHMLAEALGTKSVLKINCEGLAAKV